MPKRKRSAPTPSGALGQYLPSIRKALYLARGFERQKLSRRLKTSTTSQDFATSRRILAETDALKAVDFDALAVRHLARQVRREKALRENSLGALVEKDAVREVVKTDGEEDQVDGKAVANVCARLLKSAPVQESVRAAMVDVRRVVGGFVVQDGKKRDEKQERQREGDEDEDEDEDEDDLLEERFKDRLAPSASSSSSSPPPTTNRGRFSISPSPSPSISLSPSLSGSPSRTPSPNATKPQPLPPSRLNTGSGSIYLPALTQGYISPSSSRASSPSRSPSPSRQPAKKNRRGQRARQKIWEAKYGASAKHVTVDPSSQHNSNTTHQRGKEGREGRDTGWDAQRGALASSSSSFVDGKRGKGKNKGYVPKWKEGRVSSQNHHSNPNTVEMGRRGNQKVVEKKKTENKTGGEKLHPSWEAARARKEASKSGLEGFAGSRVVFD